MINLYIYSVAEHLKRALDYYYHSVTCSLDGFSLYLENYQVSTIDF
jgi:hypothetical protein